MVTTRASRARAADPQDASLLFRMTPPEIQNRIYHFALHVSTESTPNATVVMLTTIERQLIAEMEKEENSGETPEPKQPFYPVLTLLLTCRRVHNEAAGIFYATKKLLQRCYGNSEEVKWISRTVTNPHRLAGIQNLTLLTFDAATFNPIVRSLKFLKGLKALKIEFCNIMYLAQEVPMPTIEIENQRLLYQFSGRSPLRLHSLQEFSLVPFGQMWFAGNTEHEECKTALEMLEEDLRDLILPGPQRR